MIKLAFCLFHYFPFGGLQRDFIRIAKECLERGYQIDVFTMHWEGEKSPGLSIIEVPITARQNHTRIAQFIKQVNDQLSLSQYDLVVGFNKMPGLDVYYAADTCYQAKARKKHGWLYRLFPRYKQLVKYEEAVFGKSSHAHILLLSELQQAEFVHYYHTPLERFHTLPPGIAYDRLAPPNAHTIRHQMRREWGVKQEDNLLLLVGSGFKTKGLDRILRGIASLSPAIQQNTRLFVIGQDCASRFQRQAKRLNILDRIAFLGGRKEVREFMLAADLLVHPAYNENTGTVLLEALAAGLPVLTTDVCGYAHYIEEAEAGCVLPSPYQQTDFNQALYDMLQSSERKTWSMNGIAFAKSTDIYSLPVRAVDIIQEVMA